jgi:hypothetical protein
MFQMSPMMNNMNIVILKGNVFFLPFYYIIYIYNIYYIIE